MEESVNFDRAVRFYDATRGFPNDIADKIGQFIADIAQLNQSMALLEVGVGTGRIALSLSNHVKTIMGADISFDMLRVLQDKQANKLVYPSQADGIALPYADNTFDAIIIVHVLHLVPHPQQILSEVKRVIKPNGQFLHCFVANGDKTLIDPVVLAQIKTRPKSESGKNRKHVPDVIDESGWYLEQDATLPYIVTETAQHIYDNVKKRVWSSLWDVSDDALHLSLDAIAEAIDKHHNGNYNAEVSYQKTVTVQVFRASS